MGADSVAVVTIGGNMFVVIENTPGYMPDSEPYPIGSRRDALRVMVDMVRECRDSMREGGADVGGWLDRENGCAFLVDEGRPHDLGRYFEVMPVEES